MTCNLVSVLFFTTAVTTLSFINVLLPIHVHIYIYIYIYIYTYMYMHYTVSVKVV